MPNGVPSKRWKGGSTHQWRRVRAAVLQRDGHRCQLQLPGCKTIATHAHHTGPRELTGDDPRHIVAACAHCNQRLGDPTKHDPEPRGSRW